MKKWMLFFVGLMGQQLAIAQCNAFFPMTENVAYEYDYFDKKDKLYLKSVNTLRNISGSGNNMKATMTQQLIDAKKNKPMGTSESEWVCADGVLQFTVNHMSMAEGTQSYDPAMKVEVTGDKMDIPSDLTVGQALKDITYNMKMSMSGVNIMNRDFKVTDRKVESQENVTTPAGTFDCLKISYETFSEKGIGKGTIKSAMWYAKDSGLIKSETYSDDGKVTGRQVLTKISR